MSEAFNRLTGRPSTDLATADLASAAREIPTLSNPGDRMMRPPALVPPPVYTWLDVVHAVMSQLVAGKVAPKRRVWAVALLTALSRRIRHEAVAPRGSR